MSAIAALMTAPAAAMVERVGPPVRVPCPDRHLQRVLAEAVGQVPNVAVSGQCWEGRAGQVLVDRSADAALVVVGARGHGGFRGMRLGSTAEHVAHSAACPVIVVHSAWRRREANERAVGKVMVGLDPAAGLTDTTVAVLSFAVNEARSRQDRLVVVAVREPTGFWHRKADSEEADDAELAEVAAKAVNDTVDTSGVQISVDVRAGNPTEELIDASRDAVLLVIGSGPDARYGLEPGSVRHQVVHYASCPVALFKPSYGAAVARAPAARADLLRP